MSHGRERADVKRAEIIVREKADCGKRLFKFGRGVK